FTYPLYKTTRAVPAQYELWGRFSADTISKTYSAKIYYKSLFDAQGTILQTALVEKKTTANVTTNGETAFFNVLKKMLPDEQGSILLSTTAGAIDSASITYSFNGNYRLPLNGQSSNIINHAIEHSVEQFSDLTMLCWVQSGNSKQVYQAANLLKDSYIGIYPMSKNITEIQLFPNPAVDFVTIDINLTSAEKLRCKLLDESNRLIQSKEINGTAGNFQLQFDLSKLPAGIYFVQVSDSKQNAFIRRFVKDTN
ncbi:MAG TPA: T9SS type A sorting domain-containing protein, partial [Bacteroidia bacterium]|nr:T9SS type A sorting domain-containing protein [Bacteroidia bacterium]